MKFIIRRAIAGAVVVAPLVAVAYVFGCAILIGLGAGISFYVDTAWANGFMFGGLVAVWFTFAPQIDALLAKWVN
jgi:hypothetical protein